MVQQWTQQRSEPVRGHMASWRLSQPSSYCSLGGNPVTNGLQRMATGRPGYINDMIRYYATALVCGGPSLSMSQLHVRVADLGILAILARADSILCFK